MPEGAERFFERQPLERVHEWALVLEARGVRHEVRLEGDGARLVVPEEERARAVAELLLYEEENAPRERPVPPVWVGVESTFWAVLVLTAVLSFTFDPRWRPVLEERGLGRSTEILSGEWWRLITALTLHQDPAHLMGNMLFGGLFVACLRAYWPGGLTWTLVLLSGALGNYLNCLLRGEGHLFLGASTAVFGALGLLSALRLRRGSRRDLLLSLGAGLALLGMLGTEGERTDVLAHLTGFSSGLALGLLAERLERRLLGLEPWLRVLSPGLVLLAWGEALEPVLRKPGVAL